MFHLLLRCRCEVEFLTIWERRRFESISSSWVKPKTHTRTNPAKGSRWVTFHPVRDTVGHIQTAKPRGQPEAKSLKQCLPTVNPCPAAHTCSHPMMPTSVQIPAQLDLLGFTVETSYLAVIWMIRSISTKGQTMVRSLSDTDRIKHTHKISMSCCIYKYQSRPVSSYLLSHGSFPR
jgi:hypothetical protein